MRRLQILNTYIFEIVFSFFFYLFIFCVIVDSIKQIALNIQHAVYQKGIGQIK